MTRAQLEKQRQKDQEQLKLRMEKNDRRVKDRTVTEEEYDEVVSRPNLNRETVSACVLPLQDRECASSD